MLRTEMVADALASHEETSLAGCITALKAANRWDPADKVVVTMGVDQVGQALIRDGSSDAGVAFFPKSYGKYVVPIVAALLTGNADRRKSLSCHKFRFLARR